MNGGNNIKERGEPPIFFPNLLGSRTDGSKIFVGNTFCLIGGLIVIVVDERILLYDIRSTLASYRGSIKSYFVLF